MEIDIYEVETEEEPTEVTEKSWPMRENENKQTSKQKPKNKKQ